MVKNIGVFKDFNDDSIKSVFKTENNEIIENKDKTATEKEINEFKEYINATYYLEKEKIHINE